MAKVSCMGAVRRKVSYAADFWGVSSELLLSALEVGPSNEHEEWRDDPTPFKLVVTLESTTIQQKVISKKKIDQEIKVNMKAAN